MSGKPASARTESLKLFLQESSPFRPLEAHTLVCPFQLLFCTLKTFKNVHGAHRDGVEGATLFSCHNVNHLQQSYRYTKDTTFLNKSQLFQHGPYFEVPDYWKPDNNE